MALRPIKPARRSGTALAIETTIETRILAELESLKGKVDESLDQGRENNQELRSLRKELGLDGQHGRLPLVEATLTRHESRSDLLEARIRSLETQQFESDGKQKLVAAVLSLCGGGAGGAAIALFGKLFAGH